jgi:hypothetical protein
MDFFGWKCHSQLAMAALSTRHIVSFTIRELSFAETDLGHEKDEIGRSRSVLVSPPKDAKHSFTQFVTTNIGDPYQDPGKFQNGLRNGGHALSSPLRNVNMVIHAKPF